MARKDVRPKTYDDLLRDCYGDIWRYAQEVALEAELRNGNKVRVKFQLLKTQMERLVALERNGR